MGDLIYRLLLFLNDSREATLNYTIALTMIHNIKDIPNMTINKLADICYTSPAAISRFCRKLGYSSLSEFKEHLAVSLENHNKSYYKPKGLKENRSREEILSMITNEITTELSQINSSFDLKLIDIVIDLIYSKKHVCIFGTLFSQLMGQNLQIKFANLGKVIHIATDVQAQEQLAETLNQNSLAILLSPTGRFVLYHERLWEKIQNSESTIVTVTEARDNAYKDKSDYIIYLPESNYANLYIPNNNHSLMLLIEYIFIRYTDLYFKN